MKRKKKASVPRIPQITIGHDYFRTTVKKESIYPIAWRWTKETLQNSYDADASKFTVNIYKDEKAVEVIDDGCGMDENTLLDVFLALGGSEKGEDSIGGFGDAKKIVCFCWERWEITTLDNYLNNELIGVELKKVDFFNGTKIKVWMDDEFDPMSIVSYLKLCQLNIIINVNFISDDDHEKRKIVVDKLRKNKLIEDLGFAKLYANKSNPEGKLVVRLNGLALFTEILDGVNATCVLELEQEGVNPRSSDYILNVTREQLSWVYKTKVNAVIMDLLSNPTKLFRTKKEDHIVMIKGVGAVSSISDSVASTSSVIKLRLNDYLEKFSAFDGNAGRLEVFRDLKLNINAPSNRKDDICKFIENMDYFDFTNFVEALKTNKENSNVINIDAARCRPLVDVIGGEESVSPLQDIFPYDIIIKGKTKKRYDGVKYQRLLLAWHKMIQYVCYYNTSNDNIIDLGCYKIGFIFNDDVMAERCVLDGVPCYLLNPSDLNMQYYTWRGIIMQLLDRATHEIAHNFFQDHNGNFVATWNSIKEYSYMYVDDIFYNVGMIVKSTRENLIENARLNEIFEY